MSEIINLPKLSCLQCKFSFRSLSLPSVIQLECPECLSFIEYDKNNLSNTQYSFVHNDGCFIVASSYEDVIILKAFDNSTLIKVNTFIPVYNQEDINKIFSRLKKLITFS